MNRKEKLLMIPGPTEASEEVLEALGKPIVAHYMDDWISLFQSVIEDLKKIFQTKNDVFIITGSGSAGLEAAIASTIETGDKVVADNYFVKYARSYGAETIPLKTARGEVVTPAMVEDALRKNKDVKAVAIVHNHSLHCVTNPISEISEVVKEYNALLLVDVISSLGGIEVKVDDWKIDICCGATQKALAVPPGLAPVTVSDEAWEVMEKRKEPIKTVYLNLLNYRKAQFSDQGSWHPTPHTPSTTLTVALKTSMQNILSEGLENVFRRHERVGRAFREGIKGLGLSLIAKDEKYASNTVTGVEWPEGYDFEKFWSTLYNKYNIMIGNPPIKGEFLKKETEGFFRVGHMGTTAHSIYILYTLSCIEKALKEVSYPFDEGASLKAAQTLL